VLWTKKQYKRTLLYAILSVFSYSNHQFNGKFIYLDRVCALTCIVDLWKYGERKYKWLLSLGMAFYLSRHVLQDEKYHAVAHLIFAGTTIHRTLYGRSMRTDVPPEGLLLSLICLLYLPTHKPKDLKKPFASSSFEEKVQGRIAASLFRKNHFLR